MRTFKVTDQMYEQLKAFIVDPFDDTPEVVLGRLIEIVNKARDRWSPFESVAATPPAESPAQVPAEPPARPRRREQEAPAEEESVVVL